MSAYGASLRLRRAAATAVLAMATSLAGCSSGNGSQAVTTTTARATTTVAAATTTDGATTTVSSGPIWAMPGSATLPSADALQAALDAWIAAGHLKGATAAVVTIHGTWSGASGVDAAGTALARESALSIMSVSKTYTAAEVLALAARGQLNLDAPVSTYVDLSFDTHGATVRQLLAMRSGFPTTDAGNDATRMAADLGRTWTESEWLAAIPADAPRLGELGGVPRYNSVNYGVLAEVVEKVTGTSFAAALRADLLGPAGLDRTWVQPGETPTAPLTVGGRTSHANIVDPTSAVMPSVAFASVAVGAGSMAADAVDTAMWGYLLYGGHVIDSSLVREMEADPQSNPDTLDYALGTTVLTLGADTLMGHDGGGVDLPYTSTMHVYIGANPVAIAVLTPEAADHGTQIFDLFVRLHDLATS
ncbi:MAG: serine hydrolase domain-containing protein [Ilumatobacteraceae bacterium]